MEAIVLDVGWVTAIVGCMGITIGLVGGCFTMNQVYARRYDKQIEKCRVDFARKDVISAKLNNIEQKLDRVYGQVDQLWRSNGFQHHDQ
jgi:hypothetical protein